MSTTFFQLLSDDPQLEKQIGCMTGLLQIFDRQQALKGKRCPARTTRRRSISSGAAKALPPPPTNNNAAAAAAASLNHSPGRGMKKTGDNTRKEPSAAAADMLVLELGHRESCSAQLSSKSPRSHRWSRLSSSPSQGESKEAAAVGELTKRGGSVDLKESLRLLAKLKEAPWNYKREASAELPSRQDAPRLSYDGVRSSFEFKDALRASQRARDAPRLSVDVAVATRPIKTEIRMRPTSNVVARLMGLEELPDPSYPFQQRIPSSTEEAQGRSRSKEKEEVAAAAAVGRKVNKPLSSPSRYVMETMPRPPPNIQDPHSKALTKRWPLVAEANPGFSQDMEKQMMYLRLEESVEQRNILKDIVEVMHLKGLLHWHGAAKLNSRKTTNRVLSASAKAECHANPSPGTRDINVRGSAKVQSSRAAVKATSQKNAQETTLKKGSHNLTRRASEAVRATQVQLHLVDAKDTTKHVRDRHVLAKSTSQRGERDPPTISEVMQECSRGSAADQHHSPAPVLDTTTSLQLLDEADRVEAYVKQILDAAGLLQGQGGHPLPCCLNSTLFLALEEKGGSRMQDTKVAVMNRRLIFDCVNHFFAIQACCFTNSWRRPGSGQALVQQVVEELQCARFEDVGEMLQVIVDKDVAAMSDWSSQACELALHVERLLFKQLVDETIQDMAKLSSFSISTTRTRRQLFPSI